MEIDRDTSLQSWEFLTLFLPRFQGLVAPSDKCATNATARDLVDELRATDHGALCAQASLDFHTTPSLTSGTTGGAAAVADALEAWTEGCAVGLVIFEQNLCHAGERFEAALARAAAFNALAALGTRVSAAASSQLWTAGSHFDGCGEGHVVLLPDGALYEPPYHAMKLHYDAHLARSSPVDGAPPNASVAASASAALASDGALALKVVNPDNATVALRSRFLEAALPRPATCAANVTVLASPLAGDAYDRESGGWNGPRDPDLVAPVASAVDCDVLDDGDVLLAPLDIPPLSFAVVSVTCR